MIVKTEAIVLSAMKYGDTSKIVRLYTREFGRLSVIAKGARGTKSKFRSVLEPMNHVATVIYKNSNRELQLLSQCDLIQSFPHLSEDLEKMSVGMTALELVTLATHEEEPHEALFRLLLDLLENASTATKNNTAALYFFETRLAELMGFKPDLDVCPACGGQLLAEALGGRNVKITSSGVLCGDCAQYGSGQAVSAGTLRVLQRLQVLDSCSAALNLLLPAPIGDEVRQALRQHLQTHIEGFRDLRSERVFSALLGK